MQVGRRSGLSAFLAALLVAFALTATAALAAGDLEYVTSAKKKLKAGGVASKVANCPDDTQVTGGGVVVIGGNTATAIRTSAPADDGDAKKTPDDGWVGTAISSSAGDKHIVTVAICSGSGRFRYVKDKALMGSGPTTLDVACPAQRRLAGGGVLLTGDPGAGNYLVAAASTPYDLGGSATPEAWHAVGVNGTVFFGGIVTWAICAKGGRYEYVENSDTAPVGAQSGIAAPCPGGTRVTAGGGDAGSTDGGAELAREAPFKDGGSKPDDGWQGDVNNNTTTSNTLSTWAVCRG
jgi:hypothetical protein